ncbi:hypothetical protein F0562_011834 [Nyssa sinensis]|uniref:RNA helicase n=1 Tax=Nyssa sinensis TaxID=561372 RepID=A0A5J4ZVK0_9ASTE|nr:hypothetical protein F0562_011834 [Nyssa sinensis]
MVPTDVQSASIPVILQNHDVVIQSYAGSGKTLAYLLPILSEVGPLKKKASSGEESVKKMEIEAVIVAPSRELGMQIVREFEKLLGPVDKKLVQQLVGGANRSRQEEALKKNKPAIIVGTPGWIAKISASGKLHTHGCRYLVLDEVDQLLSFNFWEDMHRILEHVGRRSGDLVQTHVSQAAVESLPPALKHYYCVTRLQHKADTLRKCVHALDAKSVIAFMNHTRQLKDAVFKLEARGMKAAELHGDLGKLARSTTLKKFKSGEASLEANEAIVTRGHVGYDNAPVSNITDTLAELVVKECQYCHNEAIPAQRQPEACVENLTLFSLVFLISDCSVRPTS